MKIRLFVISSFLIFSNVISSSAFAMTPEEEQARIDAIRKSFATSEDHQMISPAQPSATAVDFEKWGVIAYWDFFRDASRLQDLIQGLELSKKSDSKSVPEVVGVPEAASCLYNSVGSALKFERGQYLELSTKNSQQFALKPGESITVGGWIRVRRDIYSLTSISGWLPFFSKMPHNGVQSQGDWEFMSAGNLVYLALHRNLNGSAQREVISTSMSSAWWADDPASCYVDLTHVECWHFIALSIDVSGSRPGSRETFFRDFVRGQTASADYSKAHILPVENKELGTMNDAQSSVRVGANHLEFFQGQIGSLFFAKKALTKEQLKSIADFSRCR